jgi:hypothetical protein
VHIRQIHEVKLYVFTENAELNGALLQNMQGEETLRTDFHSAWQIRGIKLLLPPNTCNKTVLNVTEYAKSNCV